MSKFRSFLHVITLVSIVCLMLNLSAAQAAGTPGSAFTYQGQLKDGAGNPVTNSCAFQFGLYPALSGGSPVPGTTLQTVSGVVVTDGYFTVSLDFGASAFDGNPRWLQIGVSCPAGGGYTSLTPRQPLTAAPYALYSVKAGTATNFSGALAGDVAGAQASTTVTKLQGRPLSATLPTTGQVLTFNGGQWAPTSLSGAGVTSVTASAPLASSGGVTPNISFTGILPPANGGTGSASKNFVDLSTAQTVGGVKTFSSAPSFGAAGAPFNVTGSSLVSHLNADLLDGQHASAFQQQHPQNVRVVARSGGDFTTITAALATIADASATNPYLIYVAPGVYTEGVYMKSYVDIQGAGEEATRITYPNTSSEVRGTVNGADNAELRFLTVESTGGSNQSTAIYASCNGSAHITHVTALASGGNLYTFGIRSDCSSNPTLTDVTAIASGAGTQNAGVYAYGFMTMTNVTASASGATNNYGVWNAAYWPAMTNVSASASGGTTSIGVYNNDAAPVMMNVTASGSGATNNYGVANEASATPAMTNVTASASGGTNAYGVYNLSSSSTMTGVTANASGGSYRNFGVYNNSSSPAMTNVTVSVTGATNANVGVENNASSPVMTNVVIIASDGTDNYGVYNEDAAAPTMTNVTANVTTTASGDTNTYGVYNTAASPTMIKVSVIASGGDWNRGVANYSASPTMTGLTATISGGYNSYGLWNESSSVVIRNSVIVASGGTVTSDGIHNVASSGAYTVSIDASQITGINSTIYSNSAYYTTRIGASELIGGGVQGSGNFTCVLSYNGNYTALNSSCK